MGVPFFSYEQGSPADLSWQAILRAFFEDPWAGATVVTANRASAVPIRIVRFILCSLLQFFSKFPDVFFLCCSDPAERVSEPSKEHHDSRRQSGDAPSKRNRCFALTPCSKRDSNR